MSAEGRIELRLSWREGRCHDVAVHNHRPLEVWQALVGRRVEEAVALAPLLSSICSMAQGLAGARACEAALGLTVSPEHEQARALVGVVERLSNHLWFWLLTGPQALGEPPRHADYRLGRAQLAEVQAAAGLAKGAVQLGGVDAAPNASRLVTTLDALAQWLEGQGFAAAPPPFLEHLGRLEGLPGRLFRRVMNGPLATSGQTSRSARPSVDTVAASLRASRTFARTPTVNEQPVDVGLLSAWTTHPLVSQAIAAAGPGLLARLAARYVETCALSEELRHLAQSLRPLRREPVVTTATGQGVGTADTSRGPLVHAVDVEQGRVVAWNVVAPTEWTFHPRGAVREALVGLAAPDVQSAEQAARFVVTVLDPCVEFTVSLEP
jgi:coenzyme F420-reducing hydrogenase alpha subunit